MRWIKLYTRESLRGSIRFELTMEEQGVWFNLLCMAGESRVQGIIQAAPGVSYPIEFIASQLRIKERLLVDTLKKFEKQGRVVISDEGIRIKNWEKYQVSPVVSQGLSEVKEKRKRGEKEKAEMAKAVVNKKPDVAIDVLTNDCGYTVINSQGVILRKQTNDRYRPGRKEDACVPGTGDLQ